MKHVHEWDGEITVRIRRAVGDESERFLSGGISPCVFVCVWRMRGVLHNWLDGNLQNQAVKCYEHGESICIFTASV